MPFYESCTLSLYCDNVHASTTGTRVAGKIVAGANEHVPGEFPHLFHGGRITLCREQARKTGWRFHRNGSTVCPRCTPRRGEILQPRY
jgi:hypothetical protein